MPASHNMSGKESFPGIDPLEFSPALLCIQSQPPHHFARHLLHVLLLLLAFLLLWAAFGRLDIVAAAEGKLIPQSYLKIVQPSEQGLIREILVAEGEHVKAGQILMRLDPTLAEADGKVLRTDYLGKQITLRRIDAELRDRPFTRRDGDPDDLFNESLNQYRANRQAHEAALSQEQSKYDKALNDLAAARQTRTKLIDTMAHYRTQDEAYQALAREGYASLLAATDKAREHTEKEQDLKTQEHLIASAEATLAQSAKHIAQITADYRQKLQTERIETSDKLDKSEAEYTKQQYRHTLLELKSPQDGIIKDLATHTVGTVISPGTILMTLVPNEETLKAEVWVNNQDVGFIHLGEPVKIKLAAYPFQKYGMVNGEVAHLSADASDNLPQQTSGGISAAGSPNSKPVSQPYAYRALIDLKAQELIADGVRHALTPGMQVTAEINLGTRTILEYLLSPVRGAFQEAGRER